MEFNKSNRFSDENQKEENQNLIHYKGEIGEFDYDPNIWEIREDSTRNKYLHFKNVYVENLELPKGLTSCYSMFEDCKLPENFSLGDKFDTSNIENMSCMFHNCILSENFTLGDKFDTSKVLHMYFMFSECSFSKDFSLGNKFNTSNVVFMNGMFESCKFTENFSLGNKFNTSKVEDMSSIFH